VSLAVVVAVLAVAVLYRSDPASAQAGWYEDHVVDNCTALRNMPASLLGSATGALSFTSRPAIWGAGTVAGTGAAGSGTVVAATGTTAGTTVAAGGVAASGTSAATVASGGVALSGSTVAAVAATAAGAFCGTTLFLDWLTREDQYAVPALPPGAPSNLGEWAACTEFAVTAFTGDAKCAPFGWNIDYYFTADGTMIQPGWQAYVGVVTRYDSSTSGGCLGGTGLAPDPDRFPQPDQPLTSAYWNGAPETGSASFRPLGRTGTAGAVLASALDAGDGQGVIPATAWVQQMRRPNLHNGYGPGAELAVCVGAPGSTGKLMALLPLDPERDAIGWYRKLSARVECWPSIAGGTPIVRTTVSPQYSDAVTLRDLGERFDPAVCQPGEMPKSFKVERRTVGNDGTLVGATPLISWTNIPLPSENIDFRRCWVVGENDCEVVHLETDPPDVDRVGGPNGKPVPKTTTIPDLGDVLKDALATLPLPAESTYPGGFPLPETEPNPNPTTTTTVPSATTVPGPTTTTTTVPQVPCPPGEPAPGCVPDEADGGGNECWPSGWGWLNPLEWVLKPIKCAARWLFIPPQPEFRNALDEMYELTEEPPLQWAGGLIDVATSSSAEFVAMRNLSLPCVPNLGTSVEFCVEDLDAGNLPPWLSNAVLVGLWLLLAYAVVRFL
jgi:hypothetical protein